MFEEERHSVDERSGLTYACKAVPTPVASLTQPLGSHLLSHVATKSVRNPAVL